MAQRLEAGKKWAASVVRTLGPVELDWGPAWANVPKRRGDRTTAEQLILSLGRRRKIIWLPTEDLRGAGDDAPEHEEARERIRCILASAVREADSRTA